MGYLFQMLDMEGLEDLEPVVLEAIKSGLQKQDSNIHPDLNSVSHPIPRSASTTGDVGWIEKIKKKIADLQSHEGNIYPLF